MDLKVSLRLNVDELTSEHMETYETNYVVDGMNSRETVRHNVPGLIQQLRDSQTEEMSGGSGASSFAPKVPVNLDAFQAYGVIASRAAEEYERTSGKSCHDTIEANVRGWAAHAQQSVEEMNYCLDLTDKWINQIQGMFQPSRKFSMTSPCPSCGESYAWSGKDGEMVRNPALTVTATPAIATCGACAAEWAGVEMLEHLAASLNAA